MLVSVLLLCGAAVLRWEESGEPGLGQGFKTDGVS